MYLLLGDPQDPVCLGVRAVLESREYPTQMLANPLAHPSRFFWRLDNERSISRLAWDEETPVLDDQITGVLVRNTGWIDPLGWQPIDLTYMQAETQAGLLAWLWSLACPVVNRYSAALWFGAKASLLLWQPLLRCCGLPVLETLVTNSEPEARAFRRRLTMAGAPCAVYGPLTSDVRYLVTGDKDWNGLAAMQRCAPVSLTYPHGAAQFLCVVGDQVVWEGEPSTEATLLEPALRRFATAAGLTFVELALASTATGICVIAVESHPHFEHFGDAAQQQIIKELVQLLTTEADSKGSAQALHGRFS